MYIFMIIFFISWNRTGTVSDAETKHVQTELSREEYERFRAFANERGLTVKEAGQEALLEWIHRRGQVDPTDPAFTVLANLDDAELPPSAETDARKADDLVYEWRGSDVEAELGAQEGNGE